MTTPEARALTRAIRSLRGKLKRRRDTISILRNEVDALKLQLEQALLERKRLKETR